MVERSFLNPCAEVQFTKNRLPHRQQDGITYFVTFRLADSLPQTLLDQWWTERSAWMKFHPEPWTDETEEEYHRQFSTKLEGWLYDGHGSCLLRERAARECVNGVLWRFNGGRYQLHSCVIMPNHVHALVSLAEGELLSKLVQAWKGASAREIQRMEGRHSCRPAVVEGGRTGRQECRPSGPIWMKDYFDRMIRDAAHFWRCARYIRRNPAKAKLRPGEFTLFESDYVRDVLDGKANG